MFNDKCSIMYVMHTPLSTLYNKHLPTHTTNLNCKIFRHAHQINSTCTISPIHLGMVLQNNHVDMNLGGTTISMLTIFLLEKYCIQHTPHMLVDRR